MELEELRKEMDEINGEMLSLFIKRMELSGRIAGVKKSRGLPAEAPGREKEIIEEVTGKAGEFSGYAEELFRMLFELSKKYQKTLL